jgi:tight adherence protein C
MSLEDLVPIAAFIGIACLFLSVFPVFGHKKPTTDERLRALVEHKQKPGTLLDGEADKGQMDAVVESAVPAMSKVLGKSNEYERGLLRQKLGHAGFHSPHTMSVFLAIKAALMIGLGVLASGGGLAAWGLSQNSAMAGFVGAAIGLLIPNLILSRLASTRQQRLFVTLPAALDLLVICIEVGRGLDQAMRDVAQEMRRTAPEFCEEADLFCRQLHLGRRRSDALRDFGYRTGVDDFNALAAVLIQSERFGTSIAGAVRELAESMRLRRRQLAEELAQKTAVKLLFPLVLFIFPGVFVVLVGPAAISVINEMLNV